MRLPVLLLAASLGGVAFALYDPDFANLIFVAGLAAFASFYLLVWRWMSREPQHSVILLDGSNVMHWNGGEARLETVRDVLTRLTALGFTPGVVFDANAGYKMAGRYLGDRMLARELGLPLSRVMVVSIGTPADPVLLAAARDLGGRVVSNDRFRDWRPDHPELSEPDHVIRGGYRDGKLWLDVDSP
ncbi:Zc3h12a-like ribonuclease protein [Aliiruegeria haliotis]|uniref:Zc3h12a-like ribonuclease protein n=1 Tax=Aliiruegeria haliotis TaxID=1280846 RepID=A0A2T0S0A6_9RHOB|nr:hypothetical protein [Aliiruegeria haliotis]PRY26733.1 Zc3h12a-like ribonuclease protein [Aliiruegeria haliotis]